MLVLSSNLQENSIIIQIRCQTSILSLQGLDEAFSAFRVLLVDNGYHFNHPLNVYLTRQNLYTSEGINALNDVTLNDLIDHDPNQKKDRNEPYRKLYPWQIITGRILKHSTGDESCFTPTIELCNSDRFNKNQNIPLSLNLLVVADRNTSMGEIRRLLEEQLTQQLDILENRLMKNNNSRGDTTFRHYYIKPVNQIVTCLDDEHDDVRKELQQRYPELSFNHPLVAMDFGDGSIASLTTAGRLLNVHKGLSSKVNDGRQTFVDGHYAYYHYMQDNFDDNQWGCAYRSLQTLCSWFVLQGYTRKPVPTHPQIQQILIDIEDKKKAFLNSRQWIGSMEVSYVLQNYLNVDCKIIRVERGIDMADRVRELISHFTREGTPIMIGGGVLAHTIIGVDFNESTGESMLLVLDPHYTGIDDIKTIQDKGWVGWKPWSFWSSDAFYNLCCPLRPKSSTSK